MPFHKGEIICFSFQIPHTGEWVLHSAVILSCSEVYDKDKLELLPLSGQKVKGKT